MCRAGKSAGPLYEHCFCPSGNLVASDLDGITHVDNVGNQGPGSALYLFEPVTVFEDWCERQHFGLALCSVESLVLDEIREMLAVRLAVKKAFDQSAFCMEYFMCAKVDMVVLNSRHVR